MAWSIDGLFRHLREDAAPRRKAPAAGSSNAAGSGTEDGLVEATEDVVRIFTIAADTVVEVRLDEGKHRRRAAVLTIVAVVLHPSSGQDGGGVTLVVVVLVRSDGVVDAELGGRRGDGHEDFIGVTFVGDATAAATTGDGQSDGIFARSRRRSRLTVAAAAETRGVVMNGGKTRCQFHGGH